MAKSDFIILTEEEQKIVFSNLKERGIKKPDSWELLDTEICGPEEMEFSSDGLEQKFSKQIKLATDIVSEPDEDSSLDRGIIKVRYRYVLSPEHSGESEIIDTTRRFCRDIITADKIYRKEDINIMSFRGVNRSEFGRYSIFKYKGSYGCRHAWQREIYLARDENKKVENQRVIETKKVMNKKETFVEKFVAFFSANKPEQISKEDLLAVNKAMFSEEAKAEDNKEEPSESLKFMDEMVGDKTLRIDSETLEVGAAVNYVDADGNLSEVEDGEIPVMDGSKILVIKGGVIEEVKDAEVEAEEAAEEAESMDEVFSKEQKEFITSAIAEAFNKLGDNQVNTIKETVEAEFKKLPAFNADETSQKFSKVNKKKEKKGTALERMAGIK